MMIHVRGSKSFKALTKKNKKNNNYGKTPPPKVSVSLFRAFLYLMRAFDERKSMYLMKEGPCRSPEAAQTHAFETCGGRAPFSFRERMLRSPAFIQNPLNPIGCVPLTRVESTHIVQIMLISWVSFSVMEFRSFASNHCFLIKMLVFVHFFPIPPKYVILS